MATLLRRLSSYLKGVVYRRRLVFAELDPAYVVEMASTEDDFEQAFGLCYREYVKAGLMGANVQKLRLTKWQVHAKHRTIVLKHYYRVCASISIIPWSKVGLPCESLLGDVRPFKIETACEVGSLVVDRAYRSDRSIVFNLMRACYVVAKKMGYETMLVACHPRHQFFYEETFGFKTITGVKDCDYALGAKAIVVMLDIKSALNVLDKLYGAGKGCRKFVEKAPAYPGSGEMPLEFLRRYKEIFKDLSDKDFLELLKY